MDDKLKALVRWIALNTNAEPLSGMLPFGPVWTLSPEELLDAIADIFGESKEALGAEVDAAAAQRFR